MKPEKYSLSRAILSVLFVAIVSAAFTVRSQERNLSNSKPGAVLEGMTRAAPYPPKSDQPNPKEKPESPFAEIIARGTTATIVRPEICLENNGAIADYGLQKVYFPADITEAPIIIITPDGRKLQCRATFLALLDNSTGQSVLLGQVRKSEGQLVGDNTVIYPDAFESINADIRYRYTKYSLEQDIILHENVKLPAGFKPENVRLEVWSEWIDSQPDKKETQTIDLRSTEAIAKNAAVASTDEQLKFGATRIGDGFAFTLGNETDKTPVAKQFVRVEDRDWLIERVDYTAIKANLDKLPTPQASLPPYRINTDRSGLVKSLQAKAAPKSGNRIRRMAMAYPASKDSVVLDFVIVSSVPVPANCVSWWPAGGNAEDALSANNDGTVVHNTSYGSGKVGQSFIFHGYDWDLGDGSADYVEIDNSTSLNPTNGLTIEAWVYFTEDVQGVNMPIMSKDSMSARQYLLTKTGDDVIRAHVGVTNGNFYYFDGQVTLQPLTWYHVAMTYSVAQSNMSIYVNGVLDTAALVTGPLITSSELLYIGGAPPWDDIYYYWNGGIDETAIYSRALSASEIQSIYNAGSAGKINPNCTSPVTNIFAWWPGDGNEYDIARTNHVSLLNGAAHAPGVVSDGFSFDGYSSHARLSDRPAFRFTNSLTIEAWINPTDVNWYGQIVDKWDAVGGVDQRSYTTGLLPGGQFFFLVDPAGTGPGSTWAATTNSVEVGGWSHVAGTYDGKKIKVYLNGVLEAEAAYTNGIFAGTNDMAIGAVVGGLSTGDAISLFPGMIDEATIYNRALTNSEITAIYTAGSAGKCKVDTDADGLTDLQESFLGTNPNDTDSDDDGLTDGDEVFVHLTDPKNNDSDLDGLSDGQEIAGATNPLVANPPVIQTQPQHQSVEVLQNATFSVTMTGSVVGNYRYQWRSNSISVTGATNATFTLTNVLPAYAANYSVVVTNVAGSVTSSNALLTVTCLSPASGMVAWWQAQSNSYDCVSNQHGYFVGDVYNTGQVNSAFQFYGTNYVFIPDSPSQKLTNFTFESWVYPNSLSASWQTIAVKARGSQDHSFALYARDDSQNKPLAQIYAGSQYWTATGTSALPLNTWSHIAATFNGSTLKLYVNGYLVASTNTTGSIVYGSGELTFGGNRVFDGEYFNGRMDESALYNRALSASEISSLHLAGSLGKCSPAPRIIPSHLNALTGNPGKFTVVGGALPATYQWRHNAVNIAGKTNDSLTFTNLQFTNSGNYSVIVSNAQGVTTPTEALLVSSCYSILDVALVIDRSGSMADTAGSGLTKIQAARVAASNFVQSLTFTNDQVAIVTFSSGVSTPRTLTNHLSTLLQDISQINNDSGQTYMANALLAAQSELTSGRRRSNALPVLVFLSDGDPDDSAGSILSVANQIKSSGTHIVTVGLGTDSELLASGLDLLRIMASTTNHFYHATDTVQLTNAYAFISDTVCRGPDAGIDVAIVSPTNGFNMLALEKITIKATASSGFTNISWVQFFESTSSASSNLIGFAVDVSTNGYYEIGWTPLHGGNYTLRAKAHDARGSNAFSLPVNVTVRSRPTVTITNPVNQATLGPSVLNVSLSANASASGATITNVSYYVKNGTNLIGSSTAAPSYTITWSNVNKGSYIFQAKATDSLGASAFSLPVEIMVQPTNAEPNVYAGADLAVHVGETNLLLGTVSDDGLPSNYLASVWSRISGMGTITFGDTNQALTTVIFSQPGTNVLKLTGTDGEKTNTDTVTIIVRPVNAPPVVNPGTYGVFSDRLVMQLNGHVYDDGLPSDGALVSNWQMFSGPGTAIFANNLDTTTMVTFGAEGVYQLSLSANDGELTTISNVTIFVSSNSIPYGANEYLYRIVEPYEITNFFELTFDDSLWTNGIAAFGTDNPDPCTLNNTNVVHTPWTNGYTDLLVRRWFVVPEGTTNLSMGFTVDNAAYVYINGIPITSTNSDPYVFNGVFWGYEANETNRFFYSGCPTYDRLILANISSSAWHVGTNLLAVRAYAEATPSFFDCRIAINSPYVFTNSPPVVWVVTNIYTTVSNAVLLPGFVMDDGRGTAANPYAVWSQTGGTSGAVYLNDQAPPLQIDFTNRADVGVSAVFNGSGTYTLRLTADDGELSDYKDITVYVDSTAGVPTVSLTTPTNNSTFSYGNNITVTATASSPNGAITNIQFVAYSSLGGFLIGNKTNAPFSLTWTSPPPGNFIIQARATDDDGIEATAYSTNVVVVYSNNLPQVAVGPDQHISLTNSARLEGLVADDGWPNISGVATWTNVSGPGAAFFTYTNAPFTNAVSIHFTNFANVGLSVQFTNPGVYLLRLTAYDGQASTSKEIEVRVDDTNSVLPTVTLSSPLNEQVFSPDSTISVSASAASSNGAITNLEFIAFSSSGTLVIGRTTNSSYTVPWRPSAPGEYLIAARAIDETGRVGLSAPVSIQVLDNSNRSPKAFSDQQILLANSKNNVLYPLKNDTDADSDSLTIIAVEPAYKATIINGGKAIRYSPPPGQSYPYPGDGFSYEISDGKGGTAWGSVIIYMFAGPIPQPYITYPSDDSYSTNAGKVIPLTATIANTPYATSVEFYRNGALLGLTTNKVGNSFTLNWVATSEDCACGITAQATDIFTQVGTSPPRYINVTAPFGVTPPVAMIETAVSTLATNVLFTDSTVTVREGVFDIYGRAYQVQNSNMVWKLGVYSTDGELLRELSPTGGATTHVGDASSSNKLATCDLSGLENGVYEIRLGVVSGYISANTSVKIRLDANLKIGQFGFSQQDLVIPVGGIPLTVIRTYNSQSPRLGDFGYGWSFAINGLDVELHEERADFPNDLPNYEAEDDDFLFNTMFSQRVGGSRDVSLTLPDGQRTTFLFTLNAGGMFQGGAGWTNPSPEVTATLTGLGDLSLYDFNGVEDVPPGIYPKWQANGRYVPYDSYDFQGWELKTLDGTRYIIEREDLGIHTSENATEDQLVQPFSVHTWGKPKLSKIIQPDTNIIVITADSIANYDPDNVKTRQINFVRNEYGLISGITDPAGIDPSGVSTGLLAVIYQYDSLTNLINVLQLVDRTNAVYVTNSFAYTNKSFPHYITSMIDARGITVARNEYDDEGRLTAVTDANGKVTRFFHSTSNRMEIITDRLGYTNTFVYDLRGNVTDTTNALGIVTRRAYDGANREIAVTNAFGTPQVTWSLHAYDHLGNQTNVVTSPDHTNSFRFDELGNLLWQRDPIGNVTTNGYDHRNNLTNTVQLDSSGNVLSQSSSGYNSKGKLTSTRNAAGQVTATFAYSTTTGDLTSTTDANGVTRFFGYDANGNQTGSYYNWTNPANGSITQVSSGSEYDAAGRVVRSVDALNNSSRTFYNAGGKVSYTVDKFNNTNSFIYDARGNLIQTTHADGLVTKTVYDDAGRAYLTTDRNGITGTITYFDAGGRATNVVRLLNVVVNIVSDSQYPALKKSVVGSLGTPISTNATEYLPSGWVKSRTSPDGQKTSYAYWPDGQTMYVTNTFATNITFFKYDDAGRQDYVVDALQRTNRFGYDALGRAVKTIYQDGTFTTNIFNALGQRTGVKDQAGLLSQFAYDISGQLTNVTKPSVPDPVGGTNAAPQWNYKYDSYGRLTVTTDPLNQSTTNTYDEFGREVTRWLPMGQTNWTKYNALGQVSEMWDFKGQKKKFVYDRFGRVATNHFFDVGATYPSNSVCYYYNQLGQLTNITERWGEDASSGYIAWSGSGSGILPDTGLGKKLLASLNNNVPPETQGGVAALLLCAFALSRVPREKRRQFALSFAESWLGSACALARNGRRLRRAWRLFNAEAQSRQEAGMFKTLVAAMRWQRDTLSAGGEGRGEVARYSKRFMPSTFWRFASVVTLTALIASDPAFNGLWNAQAACVAPSSNTSTLTTRITTFTYDVEGRLSQVNSPEGYINYDYDLITGRHVGTCTQNSETTYEYDALGRLWKVHAIKRNGATINETTEYEYTEVGSRKSVTLPSSVGIKTSYAYDDLNRLSGLTNRASDNSILSQFNYQVDATGRRTNATEILKIPADEGGGWQTNTMSWAFDGMYRLTNEVCVSTVSGASYTNSYQYDLNGNRWQKTRKVGAATETVKSYYNANDQLLREEITPLSGSLNTNYYAYDANGSLTAKTNATSSSSAPTLYTYDLKNKMSSVAAYNGSTWTTNKFEYNEQGIRVRTITGSIAKHYLVDANNHTGYAQVLEEFDVSGGSQTLSMSYVLGDDVLAQRVSSASYLLYDGHGSTRQTASNTGSVASRYNYDAYGVALTGTSTTPAQTDFLYCGEQFDSTLKMYNQRARFYDPANGRFNARDTFMGSGADPQSLHKYAYANCDPVNGIDPSGKMTLIDISSAMTLMVGLTMHELRGANAALKGAQALFGGDDVTVGITYGLDVIEAIDNAVAVATLAVGLAYGGYKLISWIGSGSGKLIKNLRRIEWKDSFDPTRYPNPRGWLPPYKPGTKPREFTTNGSIEFKRVIVVRDGGYKKQGPWVVRADEIAGKSPVEIKNHIGLDDVPSYIQDVVIPPQVKMRVGYAADQPAFNSTGGGVQYEILQDEPPASWFSEPVGL